MQTGKRDKNGVCRLSVTLEDLCNGAARKVALEKNVTCAGCGSQGKERTVSRMLPSCRGSGMQRRTSSGRARHVMENRSVLKTYIKDAVEERCSESSF